MNNKNNFLSNRLNKYSIRKVSFGTASLLIGATLLFGVNNDAQAAEETTTSSAVTDSQSGEESPDAVEAPTTESATTENTEEAQQVTSEVETTEAVSEKDVSTEVTEPETVENEADTTEVESATAQQAQEESEEVSNTVETAKETADVTQDTEPVPETNTTAEVSAQDTEVVSEPAQPVSNEVTSAEAPATVEASTTATTGADAPETRYDAALALSEELEKNKEYATATSGTTFRSAFRSVGTTRAATDYTGKIIDYPGDLVVKVDDPTTALAPGNINFAPRFVEGQSKSYAFLVNPDGTITKKSLAVNNGSGIVAYKGNFIELNNNTPEAYVYLSNVGISDGHSVDAIAKVSIIPTKDSDPLNTRYFLTSGRDYLSVASKAGGGASVSLTFLEHKDQADFDNLYNSVQLSQTTKESLLQSLDSIKGETEAVSGLLNVYDLDDYSATKSKDKRKSITFDRDEISNLYVSNETTQRASAILELNGDQVTLTSGPEGKGDTLANNKKVTVTYENQSQLNYTITGTGSSGPAFLPDGLLLLEVPPYHVEDVATTTGQDDQFVIHQTIPMRDVRKPATLPKEITLGVQVPEGVKLSLKENTTSLFTADKSTSTSNQLTIVPGKNGVKNLDLLKQQTYYNKIYDMPITASHDLTLADIENNTAKWQQLQQYYDKDEEVLKVPITYTFKNGVETWDDLTTDKPFAVMNVSDDIKNTLRKIDEAAAAVEAAKVADQAAKDALATANTDGLITPTEQAALEAAQQEAVAKKTAATDIVNALPESYRGDMPATLAGLTGINVPEVNDQNENGIEDSIDAQLADAQAKVDAAKAADKAAQDALTAANADGLISQEEADNLANLAKKAADAKTAAETAVSNLPTSPEAVKTQKDTLTNELAGLNGITVPGVNDKDGNGVADDVDAQVEAAKQAVEEAKAADKAAKDKLDEANADGLITPTEKAELEAAQQEAQAKKDAATEKVNALPEENKGNLPTELSTLTGINIPEVNDQNENGVDDQVDAQLADAKAKVDAAKAADQAAQDALINANADGVISQEEADNLADLAKKAEDAKTAAETAVSNLPDSPATVKTEKDTLTSELANLNGIDVPAVNDKDGNGVADDVDAQVEAAKQAVEEAKAADKAAKDKLDAANADGLITPTEKAELEAAQQEAQAKKDAATEKVNALPEDQKGEMPAELNALTGIDVPEVNDQNENGINDEVDTQLADAQAKVESAKEADQAAQDALTEANADGVIDQTEVAQLADLAKQASDAKKAAETAVSNLPEQPQAVKDEKDTLTETLNGLDGITVPSSNDKDGNGIDDAVDAQIEAAKQAVEEAKAADQAAKDKLDAANADGLITPTEQAELEAAQKDAADKKAAAQEKVDALPEENKGNLPTELNALTGIDVPEVNDQNENGINDQVDAQLDEAKKAVDAAKTADQAAKDALTEANADGVISQEEADNLAGLAKKAEDAKTAAETAVSNLPDSPATVKTEKDTLTNELANLNGIEVPAVNDKDGNGVADDVDAQVEAAKQAVEEAKAADKAAKDALTKANEDGLITPAEKTELEAAQQEAADKKAAAAEKVNALPEDPQTVKDQKDNLTETLNGLDGITVPAVNDEDSNGVADNVDEQVEAAKQAVEEAKAADQAAKDALTKAEEDGLITPDEKAALETAAKEAADKKAAAEEKVNVLPEDQKGDLPAELDALTGIDVPEVNDENANGVADEVDAQVEEAKQAVEEAKTADEAAKDALTETNADGVINPEEAAKLTDLAKQAEDAKTAAETAVSNLPEALQSVKEQKDSLTETLNGLDGITVPEVNDADSNGVADNVDAQREEAEQAVEEAKAADQAAKDALTEANADGLITPTEQAELEAAQQEAQAKKDAAEEKVNALPEDQKGNLPAELDALTGIDVPEVNDENANGVADDVDTQVEAAKQAVEEAKAADQAAKDELEKANADGVINPEEAAKLADLAKKAEDAKTAAETAVSNLPEAPQSVKDQKDNLTETLNGLNGITVPAVNDEDSNGVADDVDAQVEEAKQAVEAAKMADQAAKDALTEANADGVINPEEAEKLADLVKKAEDAKKVAEEKVNALPEAPQSVKDQKDSLTETLNGLDGITVPAVNDEDSNGVADDIDGQRADAETAVEEAKQADQAAKDALAKAEEDGLITPTEKAELEAAQQEAADKKATAQEKVDALPEDQKGNLPAELSALTGIDVPAVNDQNENGINDEVDTQLADAKAKVDAAKEADKAAQDALTEANADGVINPEEAAKLADLAKQAEDTKTAAETAVSSLPDSPEAVKTEKDTLTNELSNLNGITVPEVNDADSNGVADNVDAQREDAEKAVEEAKQADKAAQDALTEANADGLITPDEKATLEAAQQEAVDKKAAAEEKVNALPEDQKGDLPAELDALTGIDVPAVNDENANGVADDVDAQVEEAKQAVEAAKTADQVAKDELEKANADGVINPEEAANLTDLAKQAEEAKTAAEEKVNALPDSPQSVKDQKDSLTETLNNLDGITVPEVNDADANGVADDVDAQREDAEKAVEEAKQADQAAKDALTEANADGLITPAEKAELERLQEEAQAKKDEATDKVNALPEDQKGDLPAELDALTGIDVPAVNDENANGVADDVDAQVEEARQAVEAAKTADQAAKDTLTEANADGVINPEEAAKLADLAKQAEEAKTAAEEKVNALPETPQSVKDQKDNLTETLNGLDGITVPEVNDADANGVADDVDAQREDAEKAVEEAKTADQAAKDALAKAEEDGLITPAEKAELEAAAQEAADKKAAAEEKVNALPEDQKGDLPSELDKLTGIEIPEVNDADANGVADDVDAQREDAEKAVEEAKAADQAAKEALEKANEDGLITPDEKAELEKLQEEAKSKKDDATDKVNALPEDQKGDLPSELDKLTGIEIPEVNDADANGVADDVDAQRADAEKAVEEAKAADQAAKDALAKANEDGLITPAEKAELEKLQEEAQAKKDQATDKVNALPEDQKGDLPAELDKLTGIEIPEVNDADSNGVADDVDAQRAGAEKAVEEAKAADQAAKDALAKANEDGLITPAEKAELEKLQEEAQSKKETATDKVNALPEDQKGDLPSELDKLTGIEVPEVNDSDANGVADDVDAQRADAEKAVEEAKAADQAAKDALAKANEDGLITPAEKAELEKLQEEAQSKKETATDKVNALPEDQKGDLPSELDKLTGIEIPEVNDADANGVADDVDAQREEAEKAVEEAKEADQAAKDALAKAEEDGLITPAEKAELETAAQEAADKKSTATEKVNALPEDQKGDLPAELDKLTGIEIPEVNDADSNDVADDVDAQRADAEKVVEEAKAADQAAKDALAKAEEDGLITPAEKAELEKLQEEAQTKKDEATEKVNALPEDQKGDLPSELDKLTGIEIPEVNDADANGVADDVDAQREDAEKAVEEAKTADQAAKDALAKANEDGLITPAEKAELEKLQEEAQAKKDEATDKVNALPEDQKGDLPSELDKLTGIEIPEVNDADANGVADDIDAQREDAEKAVEEAKAADQAAKDALAKANEDGLITPAEKAELEAAAQEAADKKAAAEEKVNALPEDQKGDLPSEIDKLTGIEIPEVNDADANGVADDVDAQRADAEKAVEEAKQADQAAKDALAKAEEDGLITPAEKAELEKLQDEAQAKKDEATDKVNALPEDQKGDLPTELDKLTGIDIPEVNDADSNGVADDVDAQRADAKKAVEEAKAADQAAKDALAKAEEDGLITPAEKAELEKLQEEAQAKKDEATDKVNALPEDQKGDLPAELDKLTGIEVPEVNDADSNGVADDVDAQRADAEKAVEEAKTADQAAKDALAKAEEDGLITPAEKAELEAAAQEAADKKAAAEEKVNALPENQKGDLPAELDKLTGIEVPEVNDADSNGVADDVDAQRADAEKAVEEAKAADQAAKDALAKAQEDGLITPAEKAELEAAAQEAADKKAAAEDKVNALPEDQKGDLPTELDKLTGIEIPEVNDADANGVADDVDEQRADAEKAVEEAKEADQAAKDALAKAQEDGLITPAEKAELEKLQEEAQAKKDEATDKVNALPEDQKGDLPSELDKLTGIEVPEVNDADSNGVADDVDAQREDAEKAVEEAKQADQAAKDALAKSEEDGLITPAEKAELEKLQEEAADKKAAAEDKVNALPENQKGDLPAELDKLTGIEVPEVNDADANGVADDVDAQRADAEKAVEEAKEADQAAKDALAKANEDGLITPAEKAELEKLQEEAQAKKDEATDKVNALSEDQRGDLPSELDKLTGIEIPEVNDADANGVADDVDAQRADAEKAVEEAKAADQAAKDALVKAEEDGLITPAEKAELEKLQEEAKAKKDEATDKVNALPEDQKGDLPSELDKLTGIEIPEVNDADSNGVADDVDAQRADAEKAVEEAKEADQAAKDALAKAEEDGLITPAEKAELEKLQEEAQGKKDEATEKVNALPEDQKGDLPAELDKLTGIEVPEVNDADSNGVADDVDAQRADAEKAVEEAKAADQAAKDALAKANEDGLITPAEKAELEKLQEEAQAKKDEATDKVNALPEDQKGDLPSEIDKLTGIEIPEVNDADANGVADDVDAQRADAEKAVEEAKEADQAAKDTLAKAQEDGLITPAEKAELEKLQEEAQAKKDQATDKVNALPEDQKGDLPAELDKLTGIEVPEVNDADSNGVADDVDAQRADAEKTVEEAKAADQAAKDALAKAEEDGLITPAEKAELEAAAQEAADKKAAAEEKVNALPEDQRGDLPSELDKLTGIEIPEVNDADSNGVADDVDAQREEAEKAELEKLQEEAKAKKDEATDKVNALPENQKGDLPTELDKLTGIEVPEVNDADANGVADDVDAQRAEAEKAVEEAKAADQAAKDALAKAQEDGIITPAEKAELEALAKEAADKKATATDKVNALPEDQRGDLPSELAKLTGIEVPEVTNTNTGDTPTDQVDTGKQQEPKAPVNSPVMPKETSDNTTDVTMATGKVTETKPETEHTETQHKSQNNKVLPETGQESQQTTLFGSLFAGLGALLFFRRRKNEEEESK